MTSATDLVISISLTPDVIIHGTGDAKVFHLLVMTYRGFRELTFPGKKNLYPECKKGKSCQQDRQYEYFYQHSTKIIKMWIANVSIISFMSILTCYTIKAYDNNSRI